MDVTELLMVGIEVSVAFAGFAGIVATFQMRGEQDVSRGAIAGLGLIVQYSLLSALLCVFPLILLTFGMTEQATWGFSSVVMALFVMYASISHYSKVRNAVKRPLTLLMMRLLHGINVPVVIFLFLNSIGIVFDREAGPYIATIAWALSMVAYMFAELLLKPLWKKLHKQETKTHESANSL
jgi:hypothetical protein